MIMIEAFGTSTPTSMTVVDTRIDSAPDGERRHDAVLLLAREPAMHQPDLLAEALREVGVALLRRGDVQHLGLGDQRADPIDLRARSDGAADAADHLLEPLARHDAGRDRLPPRRLLVEPRDVHVAIAREQQRARDRRRRHHQKLGAAAGCPLPCSASR